MAEGTTKSEKISAALKGKPKSPEHRAALSAAKKGNFTEAQRAAIAATHARWKAEGYHPSAGKPRSAESIAKMSASKKGQFTEAQRAGREALFAQWKAEGYWPTKGWKMPEETKEKIRKSRLNDIPSRLLRHGITKDQYLAEKAAGNRWCWFGKHFVPEGQFSNKALGTCDACKPDAYRRHDLKKKYGVTPEWYISTLAAQGGGCAICGRTETHTVRTRNLMIDHDHENNNVRGILCVSCNAAIERIETVPNWTEIAQAYLKKYKCSTTTP